MISLEDVKHISSLARVSVSKEEMAQFQKEFASILGYFEIINELDVSKAEPMAHSLPVENVTRQDVAASISSQKAKKLVDEAPASKDGYVKVKSVL